MGNSGNDGDKHPSEDGTIDRQNAEEVDIVVVISSSDEEPSSNANQAAPVATPSTSPQVQKKGILNILFHQNNKYPAENQENANQGNQ